MTPAPGVTGLDAAGAGKSLLCSACSCELVTGRCCSAGWSGGDTALQDHSTGFPGDVCPSLVGGERHSAVLQLGNQFGQQY